MGAEQVDAEQLKLLADVLLSCPWQADEHTALVTFTRRKPSASQRFVAELHLACPYSPARDRLLGFLHSRRELLDGLRWQRLLSTWHDRQLLPTTMQPTRAVCDGWEIAPIPTLGVLADELLRVPSSIVQWLCNPRIDHYVVSAIPKRSQTRSGASRYRILEQPKQQLKSAQRDILREVLRALPAHPAAHGFLPHRSVLSFTQPHIAREAVLRMDLADFFPCIGAARVAALFRSLGYPHPVAHALTCLCTTTSNIEHLSEFKRLNPVEARRLQALYHQAHLPQGAPTSPALSNLVAYRLDARLSGLAEKLGLTYTRYADDLLFSGDRRLIRCAASFTAQVAAIALDCGFQVQHRKTRLMSRSSRQVAAGVVMNQHSNTYRPSYDQLKATLYNCVTRGPTSQNRTGHPHFQAHLLGRIGWVNQLNPTRGEKLLLLFKRIVW